MGVIIEQTADAVRKIQSAIEVLEKHPNDILSNDAEKLPALLLRLQFIVFSLSQPKRETGGEKV